MNIKLDENLPERLVSKLQAMGHNVDTVRAEHLAGRDDDEVWQAGTVSYGTTGNFTSPSSEFSSIHGGT